MSHLSSAKAVVLLASAALVAGALLVSPAGAKASCGKAKLSPPASASGNAADAPAGEVVKITDAATEKKPVVVEFHQDPGIWSADGSEPVVDSSTFTNFQIVSKKKLVIANFRTEFSYPTASDIDVYLYADNGGEVGSSSSFSPLPAANPGTGGEGYELIEGIGATNCDAFSLETRPFISPTGEDLTLKVWLEG